MKARELTPADVGKKIRWQDGDGKHSLILGHVYVEHADKRTLVLLRPVGGDLDSGYSLDGNRRVQVSQP